MKVFISWSGERSKAIASALRNWLPMVLQACKPWMSDEDLDKGVRWEIILGEQLKDTNIGIICLTPENLSAPYLHFEAGAIAKAIQKSHVCTYLYGLSPSEVKGPLSTFQHTETNKEQTKKLMQTLNKLLGEDALSEGNINKLFDKLWPDLEIELTKLPQIQPDKKQKRSSDDKIDEILLIVRNLQNAQAKQIQEELSSTSSVGSLYANLVEIARSRGHNVADLLPKNHYSNNLLTQDESSSEENLLAKEGRRRALSKSLEKGPVD